MAKIGIFAGTFDPVHAGHIAFALEAAKAAKLDKVYFLPETAPRHKNGVTHIAHRLAMLRLALKPHPGLEVLELPDKQFNVSRTLTKLQKRFPESELHLLVGSDVLKGLRAWPMAEKLLKSTRLVVGVRDSSQPAVESLLMLLQPEALVLPSNRPTACSSDIRAALMKGQDHHELLASLRAYIQANWLYVSVAGSPVNNS